jgi:hypothetical protein
MNTRPSFRLHPVLAGAIIALCLPLIAWLISFAIPLKLAAQAYLLLAILLAFRYWPPMTRWFRTIPIPHRVVFGVLIGAMILGHYTLNGRTYFPFVVWEIFPFVHDDDPVTCREFVATTTDGHKVRLITEQLFPSIVQVDPVEALADPRLYPPETTERLARAMAKVYNEHHADDPVWRVDLMELAVQLHPPAGESRSQPSCQLLKRYEISSDQ